MSFSVDRPEHRRTAQPPKRPTQKSHRSEVNFRRSGVCGYDFMKFRFGIGYGEECQLKFGDGIWGKSSRVCGIGTGDWMRAGMGTGIARADGDETRERSPLDWETGKRETRKTRRCVALTACTQARRIGLTRRHPAAPAGEGKVLKLGWIIGPMAIHATIVCHLLSPAPR